MENTQNTRVRNERISPQTATAQLREVGMMNVPGFAPRWRAARNQLPARPVEDVLDEVLRESVPALSHDSLRHRVRTRLHDTILGALPAHDYVICGTSGSSFIRLAEMYQGGQAVVQAYCSTENVAHPLSAVKLMTPGGSGSLSLEQEKFFRRETRAMQRLQGQGLPVAVLQDQGKSTESDRPWHATRHLAGFPLGRLLEHGPLSIDAASRIAAAVALGLEGVLRNDICHQDIKPANLLLTDNGVPRITDFGLCELFGEPDDGAVSPGCVVGTPHFMAPEQARGDRLGERTDVYGLGCTLIHLTTAREPDQDRGIMDVLSRRGRGEMPDELNAIGHRTVRDFIARMIAPREQERPLPLRVARFFYGIARSYAQDRKRAGMDTCGEADRSFDQWTELPLSHKGVRFAWGMAMAPEDFPIPYSSYTDPETMRVSLLEAHPQNPTFPRSST